MHEHALTSGVRIDLGDPRKSADVNEAGYAIRPFLSAVDVTALLSHYRQTSPPIGSDYHVSAFINDPELRTRIRDGIAAVVGRPLADLAPGYQLFNASFVTKKARSTNGRLGLHQDYTLVDAAVHRGLNVWIPLCDVDGTNGCLKLVAGSHRFLHISANPPNPSPYDDLRHVLDRDYMVEEPMRAGEACLFDTGVLHETEENVTAVDRVAVFLNLIPAGTTPKLYQWQPESPTTLEFYEISPDCICHLKPNQYMHDATSHGARLLGLVDYSFDRLDAGDLQRLLPRPIRAGSEPTVLDRASPTLLERLAAMWKPTVPRS